MPPIRWNAYAKINWALNIVSRRPDGYHDMEMLMQQIDLHDVLEFTVAPELTLICDPPVDAPPERNLIIRAARALNAYAHTNCGAEIRLIKRIPSRAGLGGGSSDCATTLVALNDLWCLGLDIDQLAEIGNTLGADVPFFVRAYESAGSGYALVTGTGDIIKPLHMIPEIHLLLIHPGDGLSTPDMFRAWDEELGHMPFADISLCCSALSSANLHMLSQCANNMLYNCAVAALPEIDEVRRELLDVGAQFAFMTGSGSCVVGAFQTYSDAHNAKNKLGDRAILTKTRL